MDQESAATTARTAGDSLIDARCSTISSRVGVGRCAGTATTSSPSGDRPRRELSVLVDGPDAIAAALTGFSWQAAVSTLYTAGLASLVGYGIFTGLLARWPSSAVVPWVLLALVALRPRRVDRVAPGEDAVLTVAR